MAKLRPSEIRFIQNSIGCRFQIGGSVNDAAEAVCSGTKSVNDFRSIQVIKRNNKYYSFDNRRLYVFRVAEYRGIISHISVEIVSESRLNSNRFTTNNDGRTIEVRGDKTLPHCKDRWLRQASSRYSNVTTTRELQTRSTTKTARPEPAREDHQLGLANTRYSYRAVSAATTEPWTSSVAKYTKSKPAERHKSRNDDEDNGFVDKSKSRCPCCCTIM